MCSAGLDELLRRERAALGVRPAHQRLDRPQPPGRELDLRLEGELELAGGDRPAQVGDEREPLHAVLVEPGLVDGDLAVRRPSPARARRRRGAAARRRCRRARDGTRSRRARRGRARPRGSSRARAVPRRLPGRGAGSRRRRPPASGSRANSSPPSRAATSLGRAIAASRRATSISTRSPRRCPSVSLISFKRARPTSSTPTWACWRSARWSACSSTRATSSRFESPVTRSWRASCSLITACRLPSWIATSGTPISGSSHRL